ncbi:MAG TPA: hypothetical protein VGF67_15350 [Ktedonobacteraceae bacterium]|jgi:hypothetical protein
MEPTITFEFAADSQHLRELEHQLKGVHGVQVYFVAPGEKTAPVLISLGLSSKGEQAAQEIRRIAHLLYDFLHSSKRDESWQTTTLVTIEGERLNIAALSSNEIRAMIAQAYAGQ